MKKCKVVFISIYIFSAVLLSGCWDATELKDLDIVTSVGIDIAENGQIDMYVEFFDTTMDKGSASGSKILHVTADNVLECEEKLNEYGTKTLFWSANEILFIGKSAAETSYVDYLDYFVRDIQFRPNTKLVMVDGTVADFYKLPIPSGVSSNSKLIVDILKEQKKNYSGIFYTVSIQNFIESLNKKEESPVIPVLKITPTEEKEPAVQDLFYIRNLAVFKDDKLAEITDEKETKGFLWLHNDSFNGVITIRPDNTDDETVGFNVIKHRSDIKVEETADNLPEVVINIDLECALNENTTHYADDDVQNYRQEYALFEAKIISSVRDDIIAAWRKSVDLQADFLGIGDEIYRQQPKLWAETGAQWNENMQNIAVNVNVNPIIKPQGNTNEMIRSRQKITFENNGI